MTRPIVQRASRKADTLEDMAEDKRRHFSRDPERPIPSDVQREIGALLSGAECVRYFGGPDRIAFGHLVRLRDAAAVLRDASTPTARDAARANFDAIYEEVLTFCEGDEAGT